MSADEIAPLPLPPYTLLAEPTTARAQLGELPRPPGTELVVEPEALYSVRASATDGSRHRHGPAVWFHPGGTPREQGHYVDDKRTGVWVLHDAQGRLEVIAQYANDSYHGLYTSFWPNGQLRSQIEWHHGKHHGLALQWAEDGSLTSAKRYQDDKIAEELGP